MVSDEQNRFDENESSPQPAPEEAEQVSGVAPQLGAAEDSEGERQAESVASPSDLLEHLSRMTGTLEQVWSEALNTESAGRVRDEAARVWHSFVAAFGRWNEQTEANKEACLPRNRSVSWNAVPWEVGPRKFDDELQKVIEKKWLFGLLQKLGQLKVVVLLGGDARKLTREVYFIQSDLYVLHGPHPSFRGSKNLEKDRVWLKAVVGKAKELVV